MSDYKRRRGSILITRQLLEEGGYEELFNLFQEIGFLPLDTVHNFCNSTINFYGCAKEFDVIAEGQMALEYRVEATYDPATEKTSFKVSL